MIILITVKIIKIILKKNVFHWTELRSTQKYSSEPHKKNYKKKN